MTKWYVMILGVLLVALYFLYVPDYGWFWSAIYVPAIFLILSVVCLSISYGLDCLERWEKGRKK